MSPILQAGFKRFKQNKLGLSCCILFLCVFVLSLAQS
jgi:microcin C transport system permease protein